MTNQEITRQDRILAGVAIITNAPNSQKWSARHSVRILVDDEEMYSEILDELDQI
jgi:hypothetical protein